MYIISNFMKMWHRITSPIMFTNCCILCQTLADSLQCTKIWSTFSFSMLHSLQKPSESLIFSRMISVLMCPWNILQLKSSDFLWQSLSMCITLSHLSKFVFSSGYLYFQYWMGFSCNSQLNMKMWYISLADLLQWRHNELDGVSNHQPHDCLLKRLLSSALLAFMRGIHRRAVNSPHKGQ